MGYYLVIVDKWDLNAEPNEVGWGEVLGSGHFPDESDDTITAIANPGFVFVSWNDGSTENPRVIHLTSDTSFMATFQCTQQFNLQVTAADGSMGTVTGGGSYYASDVTIAATPAMGHRFKYWSSGDVQNSEFEIRNYSNPLVVHLVSDTAFVANFEDVSEQTFNLQVSSANATMGTVTGGGSYPGGANYTITAVPSENRFGFSHWSCGDVQNSEFDIQNYSNPLSVYLTSDTSFVAHFVELPQYYLITASNNDAWGTVEGEGMYYEGEQATLTAIPAESYLFDGWSDGEQHSPRIVTVTQDTLFTALFSFDSSNLGINQAATLDFTVSPNPTTGRLTVQLSQQEPYELTIYDANGKTLQSMRSEGPVIEIDLGSLPAGQYILMLRIKEHYGIKTIVKK